ncbi:MAG TPA: DUF58 domain-containing protein [Acidimicrobiales bacterium]|nr:DUF58 domain-containing protein [Acidimicrobiales bacterium]
MTAPARRWPQPLGVPRQALILVGLAAAFYGIARSTGSGWVVVLMCGVAGTLVVALVAPAAALARAAVTVESPRDATVGRPLAVVLSVPSGGSGLKVRLVEPQGEWVAADPPTSGEVLVTPEQRGVFDSVIAEVRSAGPLGLIWWRRRVRAHLGMPLEVGPRPMEMSVSEVARAGGSGPDAAFRGRPGHELVRSVREYVAGDPLRLVHWPASARAGGLIVKELEDPELPRLAIVVDLRGSGAAAEAAASRAAGLAGAALRDGVPVTLLTMERGGPVVGPVTSPVEAGRRLARAVAGEPPQGPVPQGSFLVRVGAR